MEFVESRGASLAYTVTGAGPGLVVPWCNIPWLDTGYIDVLARHFTVVVACPRGFALSTRLRPGDPYRAEMFVDDLVAVCSAAGLGRFSAFGYSLTGAMCACLAMSSERVDAVVAGGFPLVGDYRRVLDRARLKIAHADDDERRSMEAQFDPLAALAFYEALAGMPESALVDGLSCPTFSFWGSRDEVLGEFGGISGLAAGLRRRGVPFEVLDGLDHGQVAFALDGLLPKVVTWLGEIPRDG